MPSSKDILREQYWQLHDARLAKDDQKRRILSLLPSLLRQSQSNAGQRNVVLDLGCGKGHMTAKVNDRLPACRVVGLDSSRWVLEQARKLYPQFEFTEADYTQVSFSERWSNTAAALCVNTLHEVYSAGGDRAIVESKGKQRVESALASIGKALRGDGYLIILDGVEPAWARHRIRIRFKSDMWLREFQRFSKSYRAFSINSIHVRELDFDLLGRDLVRYLTKIPFLDTPAWDVERNESYQYFSAREYESALHRLGFKIELVTLSTSLTEDWRRRLEVFCAPMPDEQILIVARKERLHGD